MKLATKAEAVPRQTRQETFDMIVAHLRRQNERALSTSGNCVYRAPDTGRKCAAGCGIKDEFYRSKLEGHSIYHGSVRSALRRSGVDVGLKNTTNVEQQAIHAMVGKLQWIHDSNGPTMWESLFRDAALKFNVKLKDKNEITD